MLWNTQQPTSCQHGPTPLRQSSRRAPSPRTRFHNCHRLKIIIANSQKQLPPSEKMFNEQREKKKSYMPVRCKTPASRLALCPARGEGRSPPCLHFVPPTQSNTLKGSFPKRIRWHISYFRQLQCVVQLILARGSISAPNRVLILSPWTSTRGAGDLESRRQEVMINTKSQYQIKRSSN